MLFAVFEFKIDANVIKIYERKIHAINRVVNESTNRIVKCWNFVPADINIILLVINKDFEKTNHKESRSWICLEYECKTLIPNILLEIYLIHKNTSTYIFKHKYLHKLWASGNILMPRNIYCNKCVMCLCICVCECVKTQ